MTQADGREIRRGDVFWVDLRGAEGHEIEKTRTCVVVQNNTGNTYSPHTIVVAITDADGPKPLPVHVPVPASELGPAGKDSIAKCEQIRTVDVRRFGAFISSLSDDTMKALDRALAVSLGLR